MHRLLPAWCLLATTALAAAGACSGETYIESDRLAIRNGAATSGDPAVVAIGSRRVRCEDTLATTCTGTLIAPRVVLTAAHCLDRRTTGFEVIFGADSSAPSETRIVTETAVHPDFDGETNANDLALLLLDEPTAIEPAIVASLVIDATAVGMSVRIVGFGSDGDPESLGIKREGTAIITGVDATTIRIDPAPSMTCSGDSGGPVFLTVGEDEVFVGVVSFGDPLCEQFGVNMNASAYLVDFITPFVDAARTATNPHPAGPIAASDICMEACVDDSDCPVGFGCGTSIGEPRCQLAQLSPGDFGAACTADDQCPNQQCNRLGDGQQCGCYTSCDVIQPPDDCEGGCAAGGRRGHAGYLVVMILAAVFGLRRRAPRNASLCKPMCRP